MRVCFFRLNYAVDLRYGVLVDIGQRILARDPIDLSMGSANVIWQGDANRMALQCLNHCASPPEVFNVTGPETLSIRKVAERLGDLLGSEPVFGGKEKETALLSNSGKAGASSAPRRWMRIRYGLGGGLAEKNGPTLGEADPFRNQRWKVLSRFPSSLRRRFWPISPSG